MVLEATRIRVTDVLDLLANGLSPEQILEELPDLEREDISASLTFASQRLNHPVVAPIQCISYRLNILPHRRNASHRRR